MNLREVREAAELHREGIKADINVVVDFALATIDPSPDDPITADWLREDWGLNEYCGNMVWGGFRMMPTANGNGRWLPAWGTSTFPHMLSTRQQFCDLARALGIPRKDGAK